MAKAKKTGKLNLNEVRLLKGCESDIVHGGRLILSMLRTVRDEQLYRQEYGTFENYCVHRWGLQTSHLTRGVFSKIPESASLLTHLQEGK